VQEHISKMLEKRKALSHTALNGSRTPLELTMERSRLQQALSLAQARQDEEEVRTIREDLANLPGAPTSDETSRTQGIEDDMRAKLALVNEKNRKANLEDIRKQEIADAERKRARRKLEASRSGTPQALNGAKNGSSR
jgi:RNA polymerase-associated protein RTF1